MGAFFRTFSALFLTLALALAVAHCCCWTLDSEPVCCDTSDRASDCCCKREAELVNLPPDLSPTLLPERPGLPDLQVCAVLVSPFSILSEPSHARPAEGGGILAARSSPDLYLFHAAFLI